MVQLLLAVGLLTAIWYGSKLFAGVPPRLFANAVRRIGGLLLGAAGVLLLLRGRPDVGLALVAGAAWLSGIARLPALFSRRDTSDAEERAWRSRCLYLHEDSLTGILEGRVLAGVFVDRHLSTLSGADCSVLRDSLLQIDPAGARLLEAYMDRRFAGWRQAGEAQADARDSRTDDWRRGTGVAEEEAYEILGLRQGATRGDIVRAHRTLMKEAHPDHGGSTDDAARLNEAKEVLLRRVR